MVKMLLTVAAVVAMLGQASWATKINFDDQGLTGPDVFASASPSPQTIVINAGGDAVTFTGGVILTNTTNLPADETSVYGSADFGTGNTNPMEIAFSNPITNFYMNLYNGEGMDMTYTVKDNLGNSATYTMAPNLDGGNSLVEFPALGENVDITSITMQGTWDFFVDNIAFNEPLPSSNVPEPGMLSTILVGLLSLAGFVAVRKRK
jgi:hypothetical protein